jgi:hypothetical protein
MRLLVLSVVMATVALTSACSSDDDGSGKSGASATGCAADNRKDIYTAGLSKPAGALSVKLVEARPGPPIKGTNAMTIEVLDATGQPVDGATVTVTPWMPDHAHGSAVKPVVSAAGGGKYTVEKIYLAMAGLWQIKVGVQPPSGGALQEATFQFCLDG